MGVRIRENRTDFFAEAKKGRLSDLVLGWVKKMPPKKVPGQVPNKKTVEKKKEKVIEVFKFSVLQAVVGIN